MEAFTPFGLSRLSRWLSSTHRGTSGPSSVFVGSKMRRVPTACTRWGLVHGDRRRHYGDMRHAVRQIDGVDGYWNMPHFYLDGFELVWQPLHRAMYSYIPVYICHTLNLMNIVNSR